jgi:hypothetical protein
MGQLDGPIGPGAYEGRIDLCTSLGGNFPDPKLSVLGSGNVGIGTITPLERLHVVGSIRMDDGNQAVGFVPVSDANGTMAWTDPATVVGNVGWSLTGNAGTVPGTNFIGTTDNNALEIRTNNFTRMSFNTIGNVGIGTTTPGRHAEISGTGDQFLRITSTNTQACGIEFKRTSSGSDWQERNQSGLLLFGQSNDDLATVADVLRLGGGSVTPAVDNTITCGQSTLRWTNIFATSGVVNTSDARDKTNIRPLDRGLAELMRLKPVRYQWKDRPEEGDKLGLIAQDLQQVLPETVFSKEWTTREDGTREQVPAQRLGVYYSDLIPVLIKAIQEQQHLIEDLQARIHTLETRH